MVSRPEIFPPKAERPRPFKGGGGICPQGSSHGLRGPLSLTTMPSSGLSSLPYSLRKGLLCPGPVCPEPVCPGPCSPPGMQWEQESPWAETRPGDNSAKEAGPQRPTGFLGRQEQGAEADRARRTHSAADSQRAAAANAKAKDPVGQGWAVERGCACALGGRRHSGRGSPLGALS